MMVPEAAGEVVKIVHDRKQFIVNLGSEQGGTKDTYFRVYRKGEAITDKNGKVLGSDDQNVCLGRVVEVQAKLCFVEAGDYSKDVIGSRKWKSRDTARAPPPAVRPAPASAAPPSRIARRTRPHPAPACR